MGNIFCLIGKSSSGKDTVFKLLREQEKLNLKPIVSYTTRPKRNGETEGIEYHFIDNKALELYRAENKVIEERVYHTVNGDWYYATIDDGQVDLMRDDYLVISTLEAYESLKQYYGAQHVIPLYIYIDDGIRLQRALDREREQLIPNYDELCRRFLADNKDFSEANLIKCDVQTYYENNSLEECIAALEDKIMSCING